MVANDYRHRAIGPNHVEHLASDAVPILPPHLQTIRPFVSGRRESDGQRASPTPFASTSCSACRHSASASRFGDMVARDLRSSRRKQVGRVPTPERRRRACEYRGSARQRPTASGPCCSAHPTENLTSGTRDGGESAPAAHLRRVITKFEHDTDLPTRIEDISRIALRFARANSGQ
jgi:hypothetical protein